MAGKSSDIADWRPANLTFTSAEYLRSNPQGGNSLEGRLSGYPRSSDGSFFHVSHVRHAVTDDSDGGEKRRRGKGERRQWWNRVCPEKNRRFPVPPKIYNSFSDAAARPDRSDRDSANPTCESSYLVAFARSTMMTLRNKDIGHARIIDIILANGGRRAIEESPAFAETSLDCF